MKTLIIILTGTCFFFSSSISKSQETVNETTKENGALFYGDYHTNIKLVYDAVDISKLNVISKSGDVILLPSDDNTITVQADVVITSLSKKRQKRFMDKYLNIGFKKEAGMLTFKGDFGGKAVNRNHRLGYILSFFGNPSTKINFTMYIPKSLYVLVNDGSGDLKISNLTNSLNIYDGSGSVSIESVSGNLQLHDNAGDITINDLMSIGELTIHDQSGDIHADNIFGSITIHDGSGSIHLTDINGLVDIHDGSGNIDAQVNDGLVNVKSDGAGSKHIHYNTEY